DPPAISVRPRLSFEEGSVGFGSAGGDFTEVTAPRDQFVFNSFFVKNVAASAVGDESDLAWLIVSVRPLFGGRLSCMKTKHVQAARIRILQSPRATERVSRLKLLARYQPGVQSVPKTSESRILS